MEGQRVDVPVLAGRTVRLEPLTDEHVDVLVEASAENRDTYSFTTVPYQRAGVVEYVRELTGMVARGETVAFVQRRIADDALVGVTRYLTLRYHSGARLSLRGRDRGRGRLRLRSEPASTSRPSCCSCRTCSTSGRSDASTSRPTCGTSGRAFAYRRAGATFEAVLRNWNRRMRTANADCSAIPRCTRSSTPTGPTYAPGWSCLVGDSR